MQISCAMQVCDAIIRKIDKRNRDKGDTFRIQVPRLSRIEREIFEIYHTQPFTLQKHGK